MNQQAWQDFVPPILLKSLRAARGRFAKKLVRPEGKEQDLSVYWDKEMAEILETWGDKNVWREIQLLLVNKTGRVLDIACGTGKTMDVLSKFPLEIHGCDISDMLIEKAIKRGIPADKLEVCDATNMPYQDDSYNFSYSIGSLEHFSESGINQFLKEAFRVTSNISYHQIPVSKDDQNHGWIKTYQSYHNNSVGWWLERFQEVYKQVYALDSTWEDSISNGKWFICVKNVT